jgi:hypothetical protein
MELKDSVRVMTKEEFESAINEDIKFVEGIKHFFKHDDATMYNKEIVICAAIWVKDGKKRPHQPINIPSGTVFCGLRHCSIISQFVAYGVAHKNRSVQGFLTSKNRFLTREEASELVKNNNQEMVVDRNAIREQLYSEDLY